MKKKPIKDSELLRLARVRIEGRLNNCICPTLDHLKEGTPQQKTQLKRWIGKMLGGCTTYGQWLASRHKAFYYKKVNELGTVRPGRLQWLDWMIEQCEKEEAK